MNEENYSEQSFNTEQIETQCQPGYSEMPAPLGSSAITEVSEDKRENVFFGIVGALLFSLAGGVLWFIIYQLGFIAGICGLVTCMCAIFGYRIFSKNISKKGIVISIIISIVVILLAEYFCLSYDVFDAYKMWYAEGSVDYKLTFFESVQVAHLFLKDTTVLLSYIKDVAIGILLGVIASFSYVRKFLLAV